MNLGLLYVSLVLGPQYGVEILSGSRVPASMFGSSTPIFDFLMKMSEKNSVTFLYSGVKGHPGPQRVKF